MATQGPQRRATAGDRLSESVSLELRNRAIGVGLSALGAAAVGAVVYVLDRRRRHVRKPALTLWKAMTSPRLHRRKLFGF